MKKDMNHITKAFSVTYFGIPGVLYLCIHLILVTSCNNPPTSSERNDVNYISDIKEVKPEYMNANPQKELVGEYKILDLSNCTRIEVRPDRNFLEYHFTRDSKYGIFDSEEKQYISMRTFIVNDPELIRAYANELSTSKYEGVGGGIPGRNEDAVLICYHNDEQILSIIDYVGSIVCNKERYEFMFEKRSVFAWDLLPRLWMLQLRSDCVVCILYVHNTGDLYERSQKTYPEPSKWCDIVFQDFLNQKIYAIGGSRTIKEFFECPSVRKLFPKKSKQNVPTESKSQDQSDIPYVSHYAMNPNCKPDSPDDMVLLFETKAGWNQNGGPEIFTFDNHDPKGGCVLFNDGTVKFIRTEEELNQLRWK